MAETEVHILALVHLLNALRYFFRKQPDVYVIGNMFFYYRQGNKRKHKAPDIMVVKGVDATIRRRSYKLWEEKAPPSVVIELTSAETKNEDIVTKPALYASLGIKEYFLFDPLFEYLDEQLLGYRMVDGEYTPIQPDTDGDLHSEELGVIFSIDGALLRVVDPQTGEFIPALEEAVEQAEQEAKRAEQEAQRAVQEAQRAEQEAQRAEQEAQRAEQEAQRAVQEAQRAEQEAQRAEQEAQRAAKAEAEIQQLRAMIEQLRKGSNGPKD
ncbi:MAG: Uma2 family endonuclease [Caldilineaceae bacterium]